MKKASFSQGPVPGLWKKYGNMALWGLALSVVTVDFLGLNYIMPFIGALLALLGFRALRRSNPWFTACWILSILRLIYLIPNLVIDASVYQSAVNSSYIMYLLSGAANLCFPVMFFFLWKAIRAVQTEMELSPGAGAPLAMIAWYICMYGISFLGISGLIVSLMMLAFYVLIFINLSKLVYMLDNAGYELYEYPPAVSDFALGAGLTGLTAAGIVCSLFFFSSYKMNWEAVPDCDNPARDEIAVQLADMGFPRQVLADLSDEDVLACGGALELKANSGEFNFTGDSDPLKISTVAVRLPGEGERWRVFHHFLWLENPGFRGTECVQLSAPYMSTPQIWQCTVPPAGSVLYDKGGSSFMAQYSYLGQSSIEPALPELSCGECIYGSFSMPEGGENHRGYLSYEMQSASGQEAFMSMLHYTHQMRLFQFPALTAMESCSYGGWNWLKTFKTAGGYLSVPEI